MKSNYNPYSIKDYEKIKKEMKEQLPRGLGSNIGDETWQKAQE
jgi:hypothetical protein